MTNPERIKAAALMLADGEVLTLPPPTRHSSLFCLAQSKERALGAVQGFITESGRFVDRTEAYGIALAAGQILYDVNDPPLGVTPTPGTLYTEDVW